MKKSNLLFLLLGLVFGFVIGNIFSKSSKTNIDKELEKELSTSDSKFNIEETSKQIVDTVQNISNAFEEGRKSIEEDNAN